MRFSFRLIISWRNMRCNRSARCEDARVIWSHKTANVYYILVYHMLFMGYFAFRLQTHSRTGNRIMMRNRHRGLQNRLWRRRGIWLERYIYNYHWAVIVNQLLCEDIIIARRATVNKRLITIERIYVYVDLCN